jgi:3-oxoacyl-[acyl-carrier-protein] synthase-3
MAARAARMAVERAGISLEDIGFVFSGSSASDMATPCEASYIARELGLEVPVLDINSACTSLFAQLYVLSLMREDALPPYVLVCAPEALTRTVDYNDRAAAVLWGDAAAAAVISLTEPGRAQIVGNRLMSSPAGADHVVVPRFGHFAQDGRKVQLFAIRKTCDTLDALRAEFEDPERRFHFVGHQANLRMLENVCRRCEIPDDRHHFNVEWYGNTGCASAASVISMEWDKWTGLDDVGVVGVGAGLTWAGYWLRFTA